MKLFSPILILLLLIASATPKLTKHEKKLVGTWKVDSVDMSEMMNNLSEEDKVLYESFAPMLEEGFKTMVITYHADGSASARGTMMGETTESQGTWVLSKDGKLLTTNFGEAPEKMSIEKLTKSELVIMHHDETLRVRIFMKRQ